MAYLLHERGEVAGVGVGAARGRRRRVVVERQRLVELGEVALRLGARRLRRGGVGLVLGGRQHGLQLAALVALLRGGGGGSRRGSALRLATE